MICAKEMGITQVIQGTAMVECPGFLLSADRQSQDRRQFELRSHWVLKRGSPLYHLALAPPSDVQGQKGAMKIYST